MPPATGVEEAIGEEGCHLVPPLLRGELVGVEKIVEHGALPVEAPAHNALRFATRRMSGELVMGWQASPMPALTPL